MEAPDAPVEPLGPLANIPQNWWLQVHCPCGRSAAIPRALLIKQHGAHMRAAGLLRRLRCGSAGCGQRPTGAAWVGDPAGGAAGSDYPQPIRVPLVGG